MTLCVTPCYNLRMQLVQYGKRRTSAPSVGSTRALRMRRAQQRSAPTRKKSLMRILQILRAHLPELVQKYPIKSLGVFGSYVRNDATPESDLDVLIELDESARISLMGFVGIENDLSDLLSVKVDLHQKKTMKGRILENVMREVVQV